MLKIKGGDHLFSSNVLSVDIGSQNIKLLVGKQQKNQVLIKDALMLPTPQDSFHDGRISDASKIKEAIRTGLQKLSVKAKSAICTVESSSIITRELVLPLLKSTEMNGMVRYEIEQYLPIMLSEYVIEYKILEELVHENTKMARILVAALPKLIAEGYFNLLKELNLKPLALDMNSNAISKLFIKGLIINNEGYNLDQTVAIIDMGYNNLNINIISKGIPQFNRIIPLGGKDIDMNIANTFNISFEDAEQKKIIDGNLRINDPISTSGALLNDTIQSSIDAMIMEIQRIFHYYTSRSTGNKIDKIYLYGGSSKINGLNEHLSSSFNIPASKIGQLNNIKISSNIIGFDLEDYVNSAGAIIRR